MSMTKTKIMIDASALKESNCRLKLFYNVVEGYKEKQVANDIVFGKAFHIFREHFKESKQDLHSMSLAGQHFKTTPMYEKSNKQYLDSKFLTNACLNYGNQFEKDTLETLSTDPTYKILHYTGPDKVMLLENNTRFCFPLVVEDDIDVMCCGTMDEIAILQTTRQYVIVDCKTTSSWNKYEYFMGYKLDPQLFMYRWALREYGKFVGGIWKEIDDKNPSCLIDGVFYKGGEKDGRPNVEFKRSDLYPFRNSELDEFAELVMGVVWQLINDVRKWKTTGQLPPRQGIVNGACNSNRFGFCKYFGACSKADAEAREADLEYNFTKKVYDPLSF